MSASQKILRRTSSRRLLLGMSLIELMIALVLGLLLTGGAITVFLSSRQTFQVAEGLGRVQEGARGAFELMARDLRAAGASACKHDLPLENVLANAGTDWWSPADGTFGSTFLTGFDGATAFADAAFGTNVGERIAGTAALQAMTAASPVLSVRAHNAGSAQITLHTVDHGFRAGDIAVICDFDHASVFQVTAASSGTTAQITHSAAAATPGNADADLGVASATYRFGCFEGRLDCSDGRQWPAMVTRLRATRWFVGNNDRGGRSLFRSELVNLDTGIAAGANLVEIVEGVESLDITYLQAGVGAYQAAVSDWNAVIAARITLQLLSPDAVLADGSRLDRTFVHTIAMRSRAP